MSDNESQNDQEDVGASTENDRQDDYDEEISDEVYMNNHDLIGVEGIIRAQKSEIEKKKVTVFS